MTKAEARKQYLQKRNSLTEGEFAQLSRNLSDVFFSSLDLSFVNVLHTFLPIHKNNEPDTWMIIDRARREYPHIRIAVPKINPDNASLDNFYFEGWHQLEKNTWGIPEPKQGVPVPAEKIDMILVPLLAVDKKGNRVGYGRGFYDKFLATVNPNTQKIGLSFFAPVDSLTDMLATDIKLTGVITPKEALQF
ncbi:MAG TPA: 5-formyltetrahydrofolate cyclo-ligase [Chryseosolibacter sp.]|nr:5-formyltetrahydrofolate cyclo-ligase [Chryseosolibacter sp.]